MSSETMSMELAGSNNKLSKQAKRVTKLRYPVYLAAGNMVEAWMLYATLLSIIATAVVKHFYPFGFIWLLAIPAIALGSLVAARAKRNVKRFEQNKRLYREKLQRAIRYSALVKSARQAVDELRGDIQSIFEASALRGDQFSHMLEKLEEYRDDYVDLLYLFQERARRLKAIRERDVEGTRKELTSRRERIEGGGRAETQISRRLMTALSQQDTILTRQAQVGQEIESSLDLIKQQACNIREMVTLVSDQISNLPLGVEWSSVSSDFESLSDTIQMTKEVLEATREEF